MYSVSQVSLGFSDELFAFGDYLLDQSRGLILDLWHSQAFGSKLKSDQTPVSEVDLRCEELLRKLIAKRFPDHGIIGEEFGAAGENNEFVWTIDPIDGTQNLINGIPTFGTIIGLLHLGRPILGWIDHPLLNDCLRGGVGVGVYRNGVQVKLKDLDTGSLSPNDLIATGSPSTFGSHLQQLDLILKLHPHIRMYYDVYSHSLAITGRVAATIEYNLKIWDLSATQALIEGAGGEFLELGREGSQDGVVKHHAVFGKPLAVKQIAKYLLA